MSMSMIAERDSPSYDNILNLGLSKWNAFHVFYFCNKPFYNCRLMKTSPIAQNNRRDLVPHSGFWLINQSRPPSIRKL